VTGCLTRVVARSRSEIKRGTSAAAAKRQSIRSTEYADVTARGLGLQFRNCRCGPGARPAGSGGRRPACPRRDRRTARRPSAAGRRLPALGPGRRYSRVSRQLPFQRLTHVQLDR
jgi:hypothetical protein